MKNLYYLSYIVYFLFLSGSAHSQTTSLQDVNTWAYQLQNININQIATDTSFELIVMDYSQDGTDGTKFTPSEVNQIINSGKKAVSYISIGEAEDYRYYWQSSWYSNPPPWLGTENPDWAGNYKVNFWDAQWQSIVFSYIDTIIQQGFDGIYMDIIDAWYYWQVENPQQPLADSLMIQFVLNIRNYADSITGSGNFLLIPQNGEDIIDADNVSPGLKNAFFNAIDAIGVEDIFFNGALNEDNPYNPDNYRILQLDEYLSNNIKVFSIEYLTQTTNIQQYISEAAARQYIPYTCVRDLDQLCTGVAPGTVNALPGQKSYFGIYPNPVNETLIITSFPTPMLPQPGETVKV